MAEVFFVLMYACWRFQGPPHYRTELQHCCPVEFRIFPIAVIGIGRAEPLTHVLLSGPRLVIVRLCADDKHSRRDVSPHFRVDWKESPEALFILHLKATQGPFRSPRSRVKKTPEPARSDAQDRLRDPAPAKHTLCA